MIFGMKLQELRLGKGWTQKELAERASIAQSQITRWEAGEKIPRFDDVQKLCKALGAKLSAFEGCEHGRTGEDPRRGRSKKS
jgi:transcriptional regulator with XRE-family HTH domain